MLKKIISIMLVMALTATVAIGGTLAYLTDRDSEANVFTVGNVEIDLKEEFEHGATLIPGVEIPKEVTITNTGDNDAWVWFTYAVPTALIDSGENASKNAIHFNIPGRNWDTYRENQKYWAEDQTEAVPLEQTWHWEKMDVNAMNKDGVDYTVVTVLYNGALASGETTTMGLEKVYLDTHVDIDPDGNWAWINDGGDVIPLDWNSNEDGNPVIYVSAYAMQTEGFATVQAAYDAYQTQWGDNGAEYGKAYDADAILVSTAKDLVDAMKIDNAKIVLTKDIIVTAEDETSYKQHMFLANGKTITIDLNNCNITVAEDAEQVSSLFSLANGGNLTIEGDGNVVVKNGKAFMGWTMNGANQMNINGGNYSGNAHESNYALFYVQDGESKIDVYGGQFTYPVADNDNWGFNAKDTIGSKVVIEIHEGALLQHQAFQYGDNSRIQLAEGCSLEETVIDGTTWYQVVKK